jgi:LPS-assembly lipoprotein
MRKSVVTGRSALAAVGLLLASLAVSACGLRPLYQGGGQGAVAQTLRQVDVGAIGGRAGWLVRTALVDRLQAPEGGAIRYRLEVELDDRITASSTRRWAPS